MNAVFQQALWDQFGASIDMIGNAIAACPDDLWSDPSKRPQWESRSVVGFWYVVYHTLFFLDLQLSGSADGWAPPPPFDLAELDPAGLLPDRPNTKEELRLYLEHCRAKARATILGLTEEQERRQYRWIDIDLTFGELLLYTMRHVQHHAGQLHLLLRQHTGDAPRYAKRAKND